MTVGFGLRTASGLQLLNVGTQIRQNYRPAALAATHAGKVDAQLPGELSNGWSSRRTEFRCGRTMCRLGLGRCLFFRFGSWRGFRGFSVWTRTRFALSAIGQGKGVLTATDIC